MAQAPHLGKTPFLAEPALRKPPVEAWPSVEMPPFSPAWVPIVSGVSHGFAEDLLCAMCFGLAGLGAHAFTEPHDHATSCLQSPLLSPLASSRLFSPLPQPP